MNPSRRSSRTTLLRAALCAGAAVMAWLGCDDRVAGTSVGTGNPTEIQVGFRDSSGAPVALTGTMQVYASTQIPVPGFAPNPLVSVPLSSAEQGSLKAAALAAVPDSLWPKGSVEAGAYKFNVVVSGETKGALLQGFTWRKAKGDFTLRDEDAKATVTEGVAQVQGALSGLVEYRGTISDNAKLSKQWDYWLFVYGTGFAAKSDSGKFVLPRLPTGKYDAKLVLLPSKEHQLSGVDSTMVYNLGSGLETSKDSLFLGTLSGIIPLPDSLRTK